MSYSRADSDVQKPAEVGKKVVEKRVLIIGGYFPWHAGALEGKVGGGQIIAYCVSEALARRGYSLDYLAVASPAQHRSITWGRISYQGASIFEQLIRPVPGNSDQYALVHIHAGVETTGFCLKFGLLSPHRQKIVLGIYNVFANRIPTSIHEIAVRTMASRANRILTLSNYSKIQIAEAYGIPIERIRVMYGGVDPAFFIEREKKKRNHFLLLIREGWMDQVSRKVWMCC